MLRVLSLGWGVQSFTLAAMYALGDLKPKPDFAVSSDTGFEKKRTYDFIEKYTPWLEDHDLWVARVYVDDNDVMNKHGGVNIPAYTTSSAEGGQMRRQCTWEWKIAPIRRYLQAQRVTEEVEMIMGISFDEEERVRQSDVAYITNKYPLVDLQIDREECKHYLKKKKIEIPPKSACVFCPYTNVEDWRTLKEIDPDDWQTALETDRAIRDTVPPYPLYLNRHFVPLDELLLLPRYAPDVSSPDMQCESGHCFI